MQPLSADTKVLVRAAAAGLHSIYEPGRQLATAAMMLLDLGSAEEQQQELLFAQAVAARDQSPLMEVMDRINGRWGNATVHVGSTGDTAATASDWKMKQERRTPRYTTVLAEIPIARA